MSEKYVINPCKACYKKMEQFPGCNLHSLNQCFVETAAAFTGVPSNASFDGTGINQKWQCCVDGLTKKLGLVPCELRMAQAPVFYQVPHYFPRALADLGDKELALESCKSECLNETNNKNQCLENCKVDYWAVEDVEKQSSFSLLKQQSSEPPSKKNSNNMTKKWSVTMISVLALLVFIFITIFLLRKSRI